MLRCNWADQPIAVIGMACRLPGADDLDCFWKLILEQRCALQPLPESRFDVGLYFDPRHGQVGKSYSLLGGVVHERPVNRADYPLPEELIAASDSVHLTMLEVAGDALRHAGIDPFNVRRRNTGVYVGNARGSPRGADVVCAVHAREIVSLLSETSAFHQLEPSLQQRVLAETLERFRAQYEYTSQRRADLESSRAASIVARTFGLTGPAMVVDAACASSLVALSQAARALQHGRIEMAIVGGASFSGWTSLVLFSQAQALSSTGSFPFDARADGFISSDGYAAVILKTLPQALADGDPIRGVIRAVGLSSDGRGKSLWAPRREGQVVAIRRAMECGVDMSRIQYVEAHGTSTQLGDATEIEALTEGLGSFLSRTAPVPVASVKGNIGHTRETAGLAGLIKTLLAMEQGIIPPATGFQTPNPDISWDTAPFHVPTRAAVWESPKSGGPRRAAVDSFGIGGLNVHLVVDDEPEARTRSAQIVVPDGLRNGEANGESESGVSPIAVVGRGAIFPGARTVAAFRELLHSRRDPKSTVPASRWNPDLFATDGGTGTGQRPLGGFITDFEYDWRKHRIPPRQVAHADPLQFMVLDAAEQALQEAGWLERGFDRKGAAVVIGTGFGGDFSLQLALALRIPEFQNTLCGGLVETGVSPAEIEQLNSEFGERLQQRYVALQDETASYSSSTLASRVTKTFDLMGGAFTVDAGGGSSFAAIAAAIDMLRSGTCSSVLAAGAQRSLDPCFYESYRRQGVLADTSAAPLAHPTGLIPGEGCGFVLLKRLADAVRDGDPILGVITGIGTAVACGDRKQAVHIATDRALVDAGVAGKSVARVERTGLSAGDTADSEATALQTVYHEATTDESCSSAPVAGQIGYTHGAAGMASLLSVLVQTETTSAATEPQGITAVNSIALNGDCGHLLVEPATTRRSSLDSVHTTGANGRLDLESHELSRHTTRGSRPRIAFAFAGQGSQYPGMLQALVEESSAAQASMQRLNTSLQALGLSTFEQLAWGREHRLGRDLFETQLSVLLADIVMFDVLNSMQIRPDVITGHSYGEYAALVASGAWNVELAIELTRARCQAIIGSDIQGGLCATTASAAEIERIATACACLEEVFVANCNSPEQTVIAGTAATLQRFTAELQSRGYVATELPVPGPFHTPLMRPARDALAHVIDTVAFRPPMVPLLSSVTNRYVSDPRDLRSNLVEQLVQPVRYVELVERLVADGVDLIIEVGPRDVLTRLHRQILSGNKVGLVASDDRKQPGSQQLSRVRALIESRGGTPMVRPQPSAHTHGLNGASPESLRPIVHFDATTRRRERNRSSSAQNHNGHGLNGAHGNGSANGKAAGEVVNDELAATLVRFVCEQTGYPPEVVDLDAELEADLGIDSIRKARLLGELREQFPMQPAGNLSLDDFPTLRHILNFLQTSISEAAATSVIAVPTSSSPPSSSSSAKLTIRTPAPAAVINRLPKSDGSQLSAKMLNLRTFSGTPYELGQQHGRAEAAAIGNVLQKYVELVGERLHDTRSLQTALDDRETYFGSDGLEELRGIADSVGVPIEYLLAFNYGLSMEFLPGCTQFVVTARRNGTAGLIHGVNEDWMLALALPNTLKRMAQVRFPSERTPFLTFSTCGELAGQNGMNAHGVAVSSTLLLDRLQRDDTTPGRTHPALVKEILERADSVASALDIVRELPRSGAWSMCISQHAADDICYVEYDAQSVQIRRSPEFLTSTNHCLLQTALSETPDQSCLRLDRLQEMLCGHNGSPPRVTLELAESVLRDRYDRALGRITPHPTKSTIRRTYTQASIVMRPAEGEVWVTADTIPGDDVDRFYKLDVNELFQCNGQDRPAATPAPRSAATEVVDSTDVRSVPDRIMNRFVLMLIDTPLPEGTERPRSVVGRVLLLGNNPTALAIQRLLTEASVDVIPLSSTGDLPATLRQIDAVWSSGAAPTLMVLSALDPAATSSDLNDWRRRRSQGIVLPYFVCQRWVQLVTQQTEALQPRIVAVTGLGGDFGLSGNSPAVEGGALAGLLKAVRHEFPGIGAKIIDVPANDPPQLVARCTLEELASGAPDVEVAYVCGRRRVLQPVPRSLPEEATCALEVNHARNGRPVLPGAAPTPHGTWIVTGGGRGVTAVVARELAQRYGLKLHLIGSSPPPDVPDEWRALTDDGLRDLRLQIAQQARAANRDPNAAWRDVERRLELDANLRAFAAAGIDSTYHGCDIADMDRMQAVLDAIRASDGPITGILHGAGFEEACRFDKKTAAGVTATLAAKFDGAMNLALLTRADPVAYFVGFGSISGRFGGRGQTDYSMASDLLAKLMSRLRRLRPDCRAVAIHWPVWGDVGMAMRPESKLALEIAGLQFMPTTEGVSHLIDELVAGAPDPEVLLYDWPTTRGGRRSPWTAAEAQAYWHRAGAVAHAPLIDGIALLESDRLIAEATFDPSCDPFLIEHHYEGSPILPLVVALESLVESATLLGVDSDVGLLRDVQIHDGMRFYSSDPERCRIEVGRREEGTLHCELRADFRNRRGAIADPSRLYMSATVTGAPPSSQPVLCWHAPPVDWKPMEYDSEEAKLVQRMIWHGPVFRDLRDVCVQDNVLWGRIVADDKSVLRPGTQESGWSLPAAVLDACLQACSTLTYVKGGKYHLPQSIAQLQLWSSPAAGESCVVIARFRDGSGEQTMFDFALYGIDQRLILDATDYRAAIVSGKN